MYLFCFILMLLLRWCCREDLDEWIALVESLLQRSKAATSWLVDYLANEGSSYVK